MTKQDLKHAVISLVLGILTMAAMQLVEGLLQIAQDWISTLGGGVTASSVYLKFKHFV